MTYTGAGSRLAPERGLALDPDRWAWQPKIDGQFATVTTDHLGRICSVLSRAGEEIGQASDLHGIVAGPPFSTFTGEFEAHTEAGNRISSCRGWRNLHLFDALYLDGRNISTLSYQQRYGALHRAQSIIEGDGLARIRTVRDKHGRHQAEGSRKYTSGVPRDLRRLPIVPMARGKSAGAELWLSYVERGQGEGVVAVRLDAPAGRVNAKRKLKNTDELDVTIVSVDPSGNYCGAMFGSVRLSLSCRKTNRPQVGEVWAVKCDGWYESSITPRFARLGRRRDDLTGMVAP